MKKEQSLRNGRAFICGSRAATRGGESDDAPLNARYMHDGARRKSLAVSGLQRNAPFLRGIVQNGAFITFLLGQQDAHGSTRLCWVIQLSKSGR